LKKAYYHKILDTLKGVKDAVNAKQDAAGY
jgi:hypothetical protein